MAKEIIINHTSHETRVAVIEGGELSELYHEREKTMRLVDNIYKGKVLNVLPGMESAFVDIGSERAAFLHIDDILPEHEIFGEPPNNNGEQQKIGQLIQEGQDVLVQVSKGPIGTKGARITSHVSIPGRNLVYLPATKTLGVSRQINQEKERERLKEIVDRLRPENAGFIIRTVAEGHSEEDLHSDINYLVSIWDDILEKYKTLPAPSLLHSD
ncbi:MAG TPA: Rne/Rng family ribonuclease, partial [Candidatus Lambdaproteobacteria bacterium]|nr:Rne/Rng family ribonuclease [Candidatus Lambdaproteobacteria bacterium]